MMLRWSGVALATYVMLCVLHVAFAQSLVASNVGRRRVRWATAWACYAAALLFFPTAWWLPPLVGLFSQLIPMRAYLRPPMRLEFLEMKGVVIDLLRGLLLGAVLWSDKFFLFIKTDGIFQVDAIFFALLPAVLAYNYYFVRLAPIIDRAVVTVRTAMETKNTRVLAKRSIAASDAITTSISRTAFAGMLLAFCLVVVAAVYAPASLRLVAAVTMASLMFMLTTVACYKLDYIGYEKLAQALSAVHLILCAAGFLVFPVGVILYVVLFVVGTGLFVGALYICLDQWRSTEYALFWRHATAW